MSAPWDSPEADILGDIREFMRNAGRQPAVPFVVFAPHPLGCLDCGMALPSCHERHGREHCKWHDQPVCQWARGEVT